MYNKNSSMKSIVFFSRAGCILPLLTILNLFFGWLIFKPRHWLFIEVTLLLLFMLNTYIFTRKVISTSSKRDNVIDVKGEVVEEKSQEKIVDPKKVD